MRSIHTKAQKVLKEEKTALSVFSAIDLALLSKQGWFFRASYEEYVELVSAYGLVLDNPNILIVPDKSLGVGVEGFLSIYDKLEEKFSVSVDNNLKNIKILVALKGVSSCFCSRVIKKSTINKGSTYESVVRDLKSVDYEPVLSVEQPKQFCIKGGIIDVYSPLYNRPARVCLYDGEVSLTFYDLATGLSSGEEKKELVLAKRGASQTKVALNSLIKSSGVSVYKKPFYIKDCVGGFFEKINYKKFTAKKSGAVYLDELYFSAYIYKGCVVAPPSYQAGPVSSPQQEDVALERGDFVCHEDFGVGVLVALVGSELEDGEEFLKIRYEDASVQLSVKNLHKLSFVSRENTENIKLSSLSKKGLWGRQKKKVQSVVEYKIKELIGFYANKKNVYRAPYRDGGFLEKAFLDAFEYTDTADQLLVWQELVQDLEKNTPMYRLLCGDVGFGKTELCIRAAFRVVVNGGKVLVLAPTSVLAGQHFRVFQKRVSAFGVVVGLYVGGLTDKQKTQTKASWVEGKIDVLVGTSALLYDDVFIKHASLFVVDEEHRFGVKDKEGVLEGFINKDVLLMSATPIPRSLNLSLSGLNDISTLGSPPALRKPIQTFVSYFDDRLILRAVEFELGRGGQVFFVHNNISSILSIKNYLSRLVPQAKILVAHSRVGPRKLKEGVLDFVNGFVDVLLCTSIIGSGIDIPNANTIIINSSHRFGLGQLHQIRGRVGRSGRQGYAYMLVPEGHQLSIKARKRLGTIEKNVSLGSGYHIAKSDLQIRGGGALFGYEQSGKAFDFGFEFYSKLMSKVIAKTLPSSSSFFVDNFVYNVDFLSFFPASYIQNSFDRLRNYRLLNGLYSSERVVLFRQNLNNIYGPLPVAAKNMINMRMLSVVFCVLGLVRVSSQGFCVVFSFNNTFNRGVELLKFLSVLGCGFGLKDFVFKDLKQATELRLKFNKDTIINGKFLLSFLQKFKDSYDQK